MVARYDGFIAKFMGDGILAYFGFPHAHEDDAERAVRAGLEIASIVGKLQTRAKRQTPSAHRHRHRSCRGRRSRRTRCCAGAGRRRRHAQSRRAPAGAGRARQHRDRSRDAQTVARPVSAARSRPTHGQGSGRAGRSLGGRGLIVRARASKRTMRRGSPALSDARRRARYCVTASSGHGKAKARSC